MKGIIPELCTMWKSIQAIADAIVMAVELEHRCPHTYKWLAEISGWVENLCPISECVVARIDREALSAERSLKLADNQAQIEVCSEVHCGREILCSSYEQVTCLVISISQHSIGSSLYNTVWAYRWGAGVYCVQCAHRYLYGMRRVIKQY